MWSSRLFWKVFLGFVGLIVLSAAVFGYLVTEGQENQVSEQLRERLRVSAVLLGQMVGESLDSEDRERLQAEVRRLGQETQTRFTVVDLNGTVLADSGSAVCKQASASACQARPVSRVSLRRSWSIRRHLLQNRLCR